MNCLSLGLTKNIHIMHSLTVGKYNSGCFFTYGTCTPAKGINYGFLVALNNILNRI